MNRPVLIKYLFHTFSRSFGAFSPPAKDPKNHEFHFCFRLEWRFRAIPVIPTTGAHSHLSTDVFPIVFALPAAGSWCRRRRCSPLGSTLISFNPCWEWSAETKQSWSRHSFKMPNQCISRGQFRVETTTVTFLTPGCFLGCKMSKWFLRHQYLNICVSFKGVKVFFFSHHGSWLSWPIFFESLWREIFRMDHEPWHSVGCTWSPGIGHQCSEFRADLRGEDHSQLSWSNSTGSVESNLSGVILGTRGNLLRNLGDGKPSEKSLGLKGMDWCVWGWETETFSLQVAPEGVWLATGGVFDVFVWHMPECTVNALAASCIQEVGVLAVGTCWRSPINSIEFFEGFKQDGSKRQKVASVLSLSWTCCVFPWFLLEDSESPHHTQEEPLYHLNFSQHVRVLQVGEEDESFGLITFQPKKKDPRKSITFQPFEGHGWWLSGGGERCQRPLVRIFFEACWRAFILVGTWNYDRVHCDEAFINQL